MSTSKIIPPPRTLPAQRAAKIDKIIIGQELTRRRSMNRLQNWAVVVIACTICGGPLAAAPTPAAERALLDQYCVTCHNDKTKADNFSLQREDINTVGDHPEVWERVIRKLRAGMMPPPGMPRPPLAKYEELRDWLEAQIDQRAA